MGFFKEFFTKIFGNFWGTLADLFFKFLVGPLVYYMFGPLYKLSGYMIEKILAQITPTLGGIGVQVDGLAAWLVEVLKIQQSLSALIAFLCLFLTIRMLKLVL